MGDYKFGNDAVDNVMLGTEQVDKIYMGTELVWANITRQPFYKLLQDTSNSAYINYGEILTTFYDGPSQPTVQFDAILTVTPPADQYQTFLSQSV